MAQPFIPAKTIECKAQAVLAAFEQKYRRQIVAPVPIEDILDCLFDVTVEVADLRKKYHSNDVLAEFLVGKDRKVIMVDETIYPEYHKEQEGRYRFTLGHETGHWILHQNLLGDLEMLSLFADGPKTVSVYRSSCRERKEMQADMFSGYILMPRDLVLQAWETKFGPNHGPENVYDEICAKSERYGDRPEDIRCDLAREFAKEFNVSAQSMQIRLQEMKLLELTEPEASLF